MNQSNPDIVIIHLSDLHFGLYLQGVSNVGEWSRLAPPHDYNVLQGMETSFYEIFKKYKDRLIVVISGDMTTAAEPPAYEVVNNYLRNSPFVSNNERIGLDLNKIRNRLYVVPGNHDVWLYGKWHTRWKKYTNRKNEYQRYFPEKLPNIYPSVINGNSITIYTIDTNRVRGFNPLNFINVLGRGEVGREQIGEIQALHNNLCKGILHHTPKDFDYDSSLKIAILHHHVSIPQDKKKSNIEELLQLCDAESVLNLLCDIGVHMILCGHQHKPFHSPLTCPSSQHTHSIFQSCAGSTTQIDRNIAYKKKFGKFLDLLRLRSSLEKLPIIKNFLKPFKNSFCVYEISNNHNGAYVLNNFVLYEVNQSEERYYFKQSTPLDCPFQLS